MVAHKKIGADAYVFEPPSGGFEGNAALAREPDLQETTTPLPASAIQPLTAPLPDATTLAAWRMIVALVRQERPQLAPVLEQASVVEASAERVGIAYAKNEFLDAQFEDPEALETVARAAKKHFGASAKVELTRNAAEGSLVASLMQIAREEERVAAVKMREGVESHPLVRFAITELGAELRLVNLPKT
jgi:DNA polymerase-3 subunit gamma/tau